MEQFGDARFFVGGLRYNPKKKGSKITYIYCIFDKEKGRLYPMDSAPDVISAVKQLCSPHEFFGDYESDREFLAEMVSPPFLLDDSNGETMEDLMARSNQDLDLDIEEIRPNQERNEAEFLVNALAEVKDRKKARKIKRLYKKYLVDFEENNEPEGDRQIAIISRGLEFFHYRREDYLNNHPFFKNPRFSEDDFTFNPCGISKELVDKHFLFSLEMVAMQFNAIDNGIKEALHPESIRKKNGWTGMTSCPVDGDEMLERIFNC